MTCPFQMSTAVAMKFFDDVNQISWYFVHKYRYSEHRYEARILNCSYMDRYIEILLSEVK